MKLFLVVNVDCFFLSHRKDIALAASKAGCDVTVVAKDTGKRGEIERLGLKFVDLPIQPTGMNLWEEWKTFYFLYQLYRKEKPDIVHHVGLKNILWGSLVAKWVNIGGEVNAVSGLGIMFSQERRSVLARMIIRVLRFTHKRQQVKVIFQNREDRELFVRNKVVRVEDCCMIKGSGVDLKEYVYIPEPVDSKIRILFAARMVKEKGVFILIEAAELLRGEYENKVEFLLCGGLSDNPAAFGKEELDARCDGKYIRWLGYRTDVKNLLETAHIVAFPSYYREGVPRTLIEAAATGRPIVTTDSIGCRDTVEEGVNGFLVPVKDAGILAERLKRLIEDRDLRRRMGENSRKLAEDNFSIEDVISKHLEIYQTLINKNQ
nr:glycosyltransferase family 4 protein [Odoribacter splanchnicus]